MMILIALLFTLSPLVSPQPVNVSSFSGGGPTLAGFTNGVGSAALFNGPSGVVTDGSLLFVTDRGNHKIRAISLATSEVWTLAGGGVLGVTSGSALVNGVGSNARFNAPWNLAYSPAYNLVLVADSANHAVRSVSPRGEVATLAGGGATGALSGATDGIGTNALLANPVALAVDPITGVAYVLENARLRGIMTDGTTFFIAGGGSGITDGVGGVAGFSACSNAPQVCSSMILGFDGDLYMLGAYYGQFRRVVIATGAVTSYYNYISCCIGQGTGIVLSPSGMFYFADAYSYKVVSLPYASLAVNSPNTYFVGMPGSGDGDPWVAGFDLIGGMALSGDGSTLYLADRGNNRIRAIDVASRFVSTLVGGGNAASTGTGVGVVDGGPSEALYYGPYGLTALSNTTLLLTDATTHQVRLIDACNGTVSLAGTRPRVWGAGVPTWNSQGFTDSAVATSAKFFSPYFTAVLPNGNYVVADYGNHRLRAVTPLGAVSTLAGTGTSGLTNGTALTSLISQPHGVAVNASGFLFFSESNNHAIRMMTPWGTIAPFAGPWQFGAVAGTADGVGTVARFSNPRGLALHAATGDVYVADWFNKKVRRISPSRNTTTVAGGGVTGNLVGNSNGIGTNALMSGPIALAFFGNSLYIADTVTHGIRSIADVTAWPAVVVGTLAGAGSAGFADGTAAKFNSPSGLAVAGSTLWVADNGNNRIRRIELGGPPPPCFPSQSASHTATLTSSPTPSRTRSSSRTPSFTPTPSRTLPPGSSPSSSPSPTLTNTRTPRPTPSPTSTPPFTWTRTTSPTPTPTFTPVATVLPPTTCAATAGWICPLVGAPTLCSHTGDGGVPWLARSGLVKATGYSPTGTTLVLSSSLGYLRLVFNVSAPSTNTTRIWRVLGNGTAWPPTPLPLANSTLNVTRVSPDGFVAPMINTSAISGGVVGVALSSAGVVYFTDSLQHRLRAIYGLGDGVDTPVLRPGITRVVTLAGNGTPGFTGDGGPGSSALLHGPSAMALDEVLGALFFADHNIVFAHARVRSYNLGSGVVRTLAGCNACGGTSTPFNLPSFSMAINTIQGLATTPGTGLIYFSTGYYYQVRMLNLTALPQPTVTVVIQTTTGNPLKEVTMDATGTLLTFVCSQTNVCRATLPAPSEVATAPPPPYAFTNFMGTGTFGSVGANQPAMYASFNNPAALATSLLTGDLVAGDVCQLRVVYAIGSPSASSTPSVSPTQTPSPSGTTSGTLSPSLSASHTSTPSPSGTGSGSDMVSSTPTPSGTPTGTPTGTLSPSSTTSPSSSATPPATPTSSATTSPTSSPSTTLTSSTSPSLSATPTSTVTLGASSSATSSITLSGTATESGSPTPTSTPSTSPSSSLALAIPSSSPSPSPTPSASLSLSASPSLPSTVTPTASPTFTPSVTPSSTATLGSSASVSGSGTPSPTNTPSTTPSAMGTPSPMPTLSPSTTPVIVVSPAGSNSGSGSGATSPTPTPSATLSPGGSPASAPPPNPSPSPTQSHTSTPSPTKSTLPSATSTISPSPTSSLTTGATPSGTGSDSATGTPTPSSSNTGSGTASRTPSTTVSQSTTISSSPTSSLTRGVSPSNTASNSNTASGTPPLTPSPTPTNTGTQSGTSTASVTPSTTLTASSTISASKTPSLTQGVSPSNSASQSLSGRVTPPPTLSPTSTTTPTNSGTGTGFVTPSSTVSGSNTITLSPTSSISNGLSASNTGSNSLSSSPTETQTPSPSSTITPTSSGTRTSSITPSTTLSASSTLSSSPTSSLTKGASSSVSGSPSTTPSLSSTGTSTSSSTSSPTSTSTGTPEATPSSTVSGSSTVSSSQTPSLTKGASPSNTPSVSSSPSTSGSGSVSVLSTPTPTSSATSTPTPTPSTTLSGSSTVSVSPTSSLTIGSSPSNTASSTRSPSVSPTQSPTSTGTVTPTGSGTGTASLSKGASPSVTPSASSTLSSSATPPISVTSSNTLSGTRTPTFSPSSGAAGSPTGSNCLSSSSTQTPSLSAGVSSLSSSSTQTPSLSTGASPSSTSTSSLTSSPTTTPTSSLSVGLSPSSTSTSTLSGSPTSSPTASLSLGASPSASPSASSLKPTSAGTAGTGSPTNSITPTGSSSRSGVQTSSSTPTPSPSKMVGGQGEGAAAGAATSTGSAGLLAGSGLSFFMIGSGATVGVASLAGVAWMLSRRGGGGGESKVAVGVGRELPSPLSSSKYMKRAFVSHQPPLSAVGGGKKDGFTSKTNPLHVKPRRKG